MIKLCDECKGKLPLLFGYILFLASLLAFGTDLITDGNQVATWTVFALGLGLGSLHVLTSACRLCKAFKHHKHAQKN